MINSKFIFFLVLLITVGLIIFYIVNYSNFHGQCPPIKEEFHDSPDTPGKVFAITEVQHESVTSDDFKSSNYYDIINTKLNNISINSQKMDDDISKQLQLTYPIRLYRFNVWGSLFDIINIGSTDFTLYFLLQFDEQKKTEKQIIVSHQFFKLYKREDSRLFLEYTHKSLLVQHEITTENTIDYNKVYFCILTYQIKNKKLSLSFDDEYWSTNDVNISNPIGNIRLGGSIFNENTGNYFTGLLGYLHFFNEEKSIHDICSSEKLCDVIARDCSVFTTEETCINSLDKNNSRCYYNNKCVPRLDSFKNEPSVIEQCSQYTNDNDCNKSYMCVSNSKCTSTPNTQSEESRDTIENMQACAFSPESKEFSSIDGCVISCNISGKSNNQDCNIQECTNICKQCTSTINCPWTKNIPNIPKQPIIRCYAGMAENSIPSIKVTWLKPESKEPIDRYTLFIEDSTGNRDINFNFSSCDTDHCEHTIYDLEEDATYSIYMVATSKFGDSPVSNLVNIKLDKKERLLSNNMNKEVFNLDDSAQQLSKAYSSGNFSSFIEHAAELADPDKDLNDVLELLAVDKINSQTNTIKIKV